MDASPDMLSRLKRMGAVPETVQVLEPIDFALTKYEGPEGTGRVLAHRVYGPDGEVLVSEEATDA
ncbi:MAG: hypothetical protein WC977_14470 [Anaerovoracaceae bacterium]